MLVSLERPKVMVRGRTLKRYFLLIMIEAIFKFKNAIQSILQLIKTLLLPEVPDTAPQSHQTAQTSAD